MPVNIKNTINSFLNGNSEDGFLDNSDFAGERESINIRQEQKVRIVEQDCISYINMKNREVIGGFKNSDYVK